MKFNPTSIILALGLSATTLAQSVKIGAPADGSSIAAGSNLTVEIDRPNSLSGSTEVAVVIGLQSCTGGPCLPPTETLGAILYNGPYHPVLAAPGSGKLPHQNFTVSIPDTTPKGPAQLGVVHVRLIGVGSMPFMETTNVTLNIV